MIDPKERAIIEARIRDAVSICQNRNIPKFVGFFEGFYDERGLFGNTLSGCKTLIFGGTSGAERVFFGVFPDWCEPDEDMFPIVKLKIHNKALRSNSEASDRVLGRGGSSRRLEHRDILGALMGTGVERDCIGDIIVRDNDSIVFVTESVVPHIIANVDKIGPCGVEITVDDSKDTESHSEFEELRGTVASLRLDCVVAEISNCSRNKAAELIESGLVSVNSIQSLKVTATVKGDDVITVRRVGKFIIDGVGRQTKKGRTVIEYRKYN
ncbi:MAG: DbpA RNA binding domain-containing protein [Clostridia bacterium]|nr:DbpA RNA binding domain-containing protein [Clostridia bacterium]